jgi:hypothetical protein
MLTRRAFLPGLTLTAGPPSAVTVDEIGDQVQAVPRIRVPARYAVERENDPAAVPWHRGCVRFGRRGNRDGYVKASHPGGATTFASHAATRGIRLAITRDVMARRRAGTTLPEVRAAIEAADGPRR